MTRIYPFHVYLFARPSVGGYTHRIVAQWSDGLWYFESLSDFFAPALPDAGPPGKGWPDELDAAAAALLDAEES